MVPSLKSLCLFKNQAGIPFPIGSLRMLVRLLTSSSLNSPALLPAVGYYNESIAKQNEPSVDVDFCLFAENESESSTNTLDDSDSIRDLSLTINVCV